MKKMHWNLDGPSEAEIYTETTPEGEEQIVLKDKFDRTVIPFETLMGRVIHDQMVVTEALLDMCCESDTHHKIKLAVMDDIAIAYFG